MRSPYAWPVLGGCLRWAHACHLGRLVHWLYDADYPETELDPVA